jgi:hypothetical protein
LQIFRPNHVVWNPWLFLALDAAIENMSQAQLAVGAFA